LSGRNLPYLRRITWCDASSATDVSPEFAN
jgi:hypothetical protein